MCNTAFEDQTVAMVTAVSVKTECFFFVFLQVAVHLGHTCPPTLMLTGRNEASLSHANHYLRVTFRVACPEMYFETDTGVFKDLGPLTGAAEQTCVSFRHRLCLFVGIATLKDPCQRGYMTATM